MHTGGIVSTASRSVFDLVVDLFASHFTMPKLNAQALVSVQPMSRPHAQIFYADIKWVRRKRHRGTPEGPRSRLTRRERRSSWECARWFGSVPCLQEELELERWTRKGARIRLRILAKRAHVGAGQKNCAGKGVLLPGCDGMVMVPRSQTARGGPTVLAEARAGLRRAAGVYERYGGFPGVNARNYTKIQLTGRGRHALSNRRLMQVLP